MDILHLPPKTHTQSCCIKHGYAIGPLQKKSPADTNVQFMWAVNTYQMKPWWYHGMLLAGQNIPAEKEPLICLISAGLAGLPAWSIWSSILKSSHNTGHFFKMFLKENSFAHQGCTNFFNNEVKTVILFLSKETFKKHLNYSKFWPAV